MSAVILDIQNITKVYKREKIVRALDGVSLQVMQGEILALLGVNGAGKTTLSSILATLHPPTSGDVLFQGKSIYKDIQRYRSSLGFCPQYANLDPYLTVEENLLFAGRYFLMSKEQIKIKMAELMKQFDLYKYADFLVSELSGGWKQRLLIARALMHDPAIVILDEPTVGLDPDVRRALWSYIKLLKTKGITVILTTHYLDEAEILSDRICILSKGKVLLIEELTALKEKHKKDTLEELFLHLLAQEEGMEQKQQ